MSIKHVITIVRTMIFTHVGVLPPDLCLRGWGQPRFALDGARALRWCGGGRTPARDLQGSASNAAAGGPARECGRPLQEDRAVVLATRYARRQPIAAPAAAQRPHLQDGRLGGAL